MPLPVAPAAVMENAATGIDNAPAVVGGADNAAAPEAGPDNTVALTAPKTPPAPTVAAVGGNGPLTGPFQLLLEASEQTWLMYSFDDGDPIDVTLFPGDKISIQAQRQIVLKVGNAGGVAGTLNGRRLPPFGERGQVRKYTLGP